MKTSKVLCNNCNEEFIIQGLKEKKIDDITVKYFECPECKDKYIAACEDKLIRCMKNKHEEMKKELSKHMNKELSKHMNKMFRYSDSLKAKVIDRL